MVASDLEQSIFKTVAYFSLFDFPLTAFEVWKWLLQPSAVYRLEDVQLVLTTSDWIKNRLVFENGFFVLRGKEGTVATRHERFLDATRKFKRLRRVAWYLAFLPMVKSLTVCNTLAWMNTKAESDIDLFVGVKPGCLWTARAFAVLPFALLGLRPKAGAIDPLCFSFFASTEVADLRPLRLNNHDVYLASWTRSLVPVADKGVFGDFVQKNDWVSGIFPNSFAVRPARSRRMKTWNAHPDLARWMEPLFRRLQQSRLPKELKDLANKDTRVIVRDDMLKFHPNDRRAEFQQSLKDLCAKI